MCTNGPRWCKRCTHYTNWSHLKVPCARATDWRHFHIKSLVDSRHFCDATHASSSDLTSQFICFPQTINLADVAEVLETMRQLDCVDWNRPQSLKTEAWFKGVKEGLAQPMSYAACDSSFNCLRLTTVSSSGWHLHWSSHRCPATPTASHDWNQYPRSPQPSWQTCNNEHRKSIVPSFSLSIVHCSAGVSVLKGQDFNHKTDIYSKGPVLIFGDALIRRKHTTNLHRVTSSFMQRACYQVWLTDSSQDIGARQFSEMTPQSPRAFAGKTPSPPDWQQVSHRVRKWECR